LIETTKLEQETENTIVADHGSDRRPTSAIERLIASSYFHLLLLALIVAVCFGRTLTSYFLADDFGEVSYVSRIFNGEPQLLLSNFTGNYMQIPGMNVYRPWLLVSLAVDFLLYKANATGFYFTNLAYFTGVVVLTYLVTMHLTKAWSRTRSSVAAFFGAALFAANPLRCESVSWVVGRVDIICCFFYLLSFLLFLKSKQPVLSNSNLSADGTWTRDHGKATDNNSNSKLSEGTESRQVTQGGTKQAAQLRTCRLYKTLAVLSFFLAMGTKEMAIGLPVLLTVTEFLGIGGDSQSRTFKQKLRDAAVFSAPLWISTVVYFIIRYLCLGTLGGGYVGGFGASQIYFMVQRWLDPDTIKRLFFPFCHSLFSNAPVYSQLLTVCYGAMFTLGLIRLTEKKISVRWFIFLSAWIVTAAVPIFQLWGLGFDLEGARFYFFLSIPLCLMVPLLLLHPSSTVRTAAELKLLVATAVTLTATICVLGRVAYLTDLEWVHAGKENRQVSLQAQKLAQSEKQEQLPVLGIPKERNGAHQILNGSTFGTMLNPPFTSAALSNRFATFDPIMFGPAEFINASRFKFVLRSNSTGEVFVWDKDKSSFRRMILDAKSKPIGTLVLPLPRSADGWLPHAHSHATYKFKDSAVQMTVMQEGDSVQVAGLDINPTAADFLQFDYKATAVPAAGLFTVYATGSEPTESEASAPMSDSSVFKTARVRLSRSWKWFCQGDIKSLTVQPYPCSEVVMRNFKLVSSDLVCPDLSISTAKVDGNGVAHVAAGNVIVELDSRKVVGASTFEIEIGKVNYFFDNFERVIAASPVATTVRTSLKAPRTHIDEANFKTPGFYELRARCLDVAGKPIGEYSDNLTLRIGQPESKTSGK
jgi:hypothetical protein